MRIAIEFTLAAFLVLTAGQAGAGQDPLARYRGASRLLVLSAPDASDRCLAEQRAAIAAARAGAAERDLVIVEAVGAGARADAIRRRLHLSADTFRAVLVGTDGEAKITAEEPIPPQRLFSTIDAMPMRREEMRRAR